MSDSSPHPLYSAFATACAFLVGAPATLLFATLATLFGWIPPRGNIMLWCGRTWSKILIAASWTRLEASFEEPLDPEKSYIYLANHQSYFDIMALLATVPSQVRFAAKASLFRIPIFGWSLSAGGFIPIDRRDRSRAKKAFATAATRLQRGASVLFFPEGTRSHDGTFGKFERGGFLLALRSGVTIVPVGIRGAREVLPRGSVRVRPGRIEVHFGRVVDPADFGIRGRQELVEEVRGRIAVLADVPLVD